MPHILAQTYLNNLRATARKNGTRMQGNKSHTPEDEQKAEQLSTKFNKASAWPEGKSLILRAIGLGNRYDMPISDALLPAVAKNLMNDLVANTRHFNGGKKFAHYVSLTLYQGKQFIEDSKEYAHISNVSMLFKHAAHDHPREPMDFVRATVRTVKRLAANPKFNTFAEFASGPSIFMRAAITHSRDPEKYLSEMQSAILAAKKKPEFAAFKHRTGVMREAAKGNPKLTERNLRRIRKSGQAGYARGRWGSSAARQP